MRRSIVAILLVMALSGCAGSGTDTEGADSGSSAHPAESGILSGRLTAVGSSTSQPMAIAKAGHERLSAVLVLTSNMPQSSLGLNVTGPDGRTDEVRTGPTLFVLPGGRPAISFGSPTVGDWIARVELRSGASADYEVHWCADDAESTGPQDNLACHRDMA